jgi:hypothetical protein
MDGAALAQHLHQVHAGRGGPVHIVAGAVLRLVPRLDFTIKLPKLYIVTIKQLFGALSGRIVVIAEDVDGPDKMPVVTNHVRPILCHWLPSL